MSAILPVRCAPGRRLTRGQVYHHGIQTRPATVLPDDIAAAIIEHACTRAFVDRMADELVERYPDFYPEPLEADAMGIPRP